MTANVIRSREGLTQGDPLDMVAHGIVIILLIKQTKSIHPEITHPWYADDAGALGMLDNLEKYFNLLKHNVPDRGY